MRDTLPVEVERFLREIKGVPATANEIAMGVRARRDDVDEVLKGAAFTRVPPPLGCSPYAHYFDLSPRVPQPERAQLTLLSERTIHRTTDPHTSADAAKRHGARHTNAAAMLRAYASAPLTDVEAARIAGLERVEATRRASDLRNKRLIEPLRNPADGELITRPLPSGRAGMVCAITAAGREQLGEADEAA